MRPKTRGPARVLPPEEVASIVRRYREDREPASALAREFGLSIRTVRRYIADPEGLIRRRFRRAIDTWPSAFALTEQQRDSLAAHLDEEYSRWLSNR